MLQDDKSHRRKYQFMGDLLILSKVDDVERVKLPECGGRSSKQNNKGTVSPSYHAPKGEIA